MPSKAKKKKSEEVAKKKVRKIPCPLCKKQIAANAESMGKHMRLKHTDVTDKIVWEKLGKEGQVQFFCRYCHEISGNPRMADCAGCNMPAKMQIALLGKIDAKLSEMSEEIVDISSNVTILADMDDVQETGDTEEPVPSPEEEGEEEEGEEIEEETEEEEE